MDPRRLIPVLAAAAAAMVVATLVVLLLRPAPPGPGPAGGAAGRAVGAGAPPATAGARAAGGSGGTGTPSAVLAGWDRRRAGAWARGDVDALGGLYAPGSAAGRADVAMLRDYRRRGLRVEGLTTQVLRLEVLRRAPGRLVLRVTDRLAGGTVVGAAAPVALPADRASTRQVTLVRRPGADDDGWVVREVVEVGAQARAAASTSRTSSSSKS